MGQPVDDKETEKGLKSQELSKLTEQTIRFKLLLDFGYQIKCNKKSWRFYFNFWRGTIFWKNKGNNHELQGLNA